MNTVEPIWNSNLYDSKHDFVSKYGQDVVKLLAPKKGEHILDVGCGTGDLADMIYQEGAFVFGIDNSPEMVATAQKKYANIKFEVHSAENFKLTEQFDAVFSNATLHWVLEKEKAIDCIYDCLKDKGRFVAEFGGKANVESIVISLKKALTELGFLENANTLVWYFPSLSEYTTLLEKRGFRVCYATHFDRPTELKDENGIRNWLEMFTKLFMKNLQKPEIDAVLDKVEQDLKKTNYQNGKWYADYKRLRILAIKQ
ncbi:MAG: class I SAM-dependent methyltransferase [Bacteroidetes bacterium]|nr:MAG: class I SAM-dependent methyltransferase [Bacteroidota bacterium]